MAIHRQEQFDLITEKLKKYKKDDKDDKVVDDTKVYIEDIVRPPLMHENP